ncbi:MAG: hypothetical protein QW367_02990 [Candidatus Aenigmatarchaeota archaeon]
MNCIDSDGDCNVERIKYLDNEYETIDLLYYPFGYLIARDFEIEIPDENEIDYLNISVFWYSDVGEGAGNIYIEYSFDGTNWYYCSGPYSESSEIVHSYCSLSSISKEQLQNLMVRFRGEDLDGFPMAFAYVDQISLYVHHSSAPKLRNQTTNTTNDFIYFDQAIELSIEVFSDNGISCVWLSTNESGNWINYTDGTYNSPICLDGISNTWIKVNFTWKNSSAIGYVGWKIYVNDTLGKINVSDEKTFFVQYRVFPMNCIDSDGDCNVERIKYLDNEYETIDLLYYPFGYLIARDFEINLKGNILIRDASIHVFWYSDVGEGAGNIYIEYSFDGTNWYYCSGPYSESSEIVHSYCSLSSISKEQLQNLMVRFRGEDLDGFPMAFAYVDQIFVSFNFSYVYSYLEVILTSPKTNVINNIFQNSTFFVNVSIFCRNGNCTDVKAVIRYNESSPYPNTPINETYGAKPFFIDEENPNSIKYCGNMSMDEKCDLYWIINASGNVKSIWKIGVLVFSSDGIYNHTENATIKIIGCVIDVTLTFDKISFGDVLPNVIGNPAEGNNNEEYKIIVNPGSCSIDAYIKGYDLYNDTYNSKIPVQNIKVSNQSNDYSNSFSLDYEFKLLIKSLAQNSIKPIFFWLDVPPVFAGIYYGTITIKIVEEDELP